MAVAYKPALALVAVVALVSASPAFAGGISDDIVKIGVLTDMSGQFSHESGEGAVTAVRMAVEDFGGTVLGKPIEVVSADHQNKPDIAASIARKWYDLEKVDMIANLSIRQSRSEYPKLPRRRIASPSLTARGRRA
jgi:branched-chain amino acid transport system substrate-binding protein